MAKVTFAQKVHETQSHLEITIETKTQLIVLFGFYGHAGTRNL